LRESRYFPVISKSAGPFRVDADLKDNLSRVTAMKVFDTNACVQMERNYITNMSGGSGNVAVGNYPVSIGVNFTLALLFFICITGFVTNSSRVDEYFCTL